MKRFIRIILAVVLLIFMSAHSFAYDYNTLGYYNSTIFIKNQLTKYTNEFSDAVGYWNNAGVIDRSITVNTVSSSFITNFRFSDYSNYWYLYYQQAEGVYEPLTYYAYACSCHQVTSFQISISENEMDNYPFSESNNYKARTGTIVHELGHAFGLIDYDGEYPTYSVMDWDHIRYLIYTPQQMDINNANACWEIHR